MPCSWCLKPIKWVVNSPPASPPLITARGRNGRGLGSSYASMPEQKAEVMQTPCKCWFLARPAVLLQAGSRRRPPPQAKRAKACPWLRACGCWPSRSRSGAWGSWLWRRPDHQPGGHCVEDAPAHAAPRPRAICGTLLLQSSGCLCQPGWRWLAFAAATHKGSCRFQRVHTRGVRPATEWTLGPHSRNVAGAMTL